MTISYDKSNRKHISTFYLIIPKALNYELDYFSFLAFTVFLDYCGTFFTYKIYDILEIIAYNLTKHRKRMGGYI